MTDNLAAALAAFQADMPTVAKSKTAKAGSYSYTYADLAAISAVAMPRLAAQGLSFTCSPRVAEHGLELAATLLHVGGETREGALPLRGNTPQELGSSITYMRRYLLGCMTGIVTDDDDDGQMAQAAAKKTTRQPERSQQTRTMSRNDNGRGSDEITDGQLKLLQVCLKEAGIHDRDAGLAFYTDTVGRHVESSKELTKQEARKVIDALKAIADTVSVPTSDDDPWAGVEVRGPAT